MYLHSLYLHVVMLNSLSRGTTLVICVKLFAFAWIPFQICCRSSSVSVVTRRRAGRPDNRGQKFILLTTVSKPCSSVGIATGYGLNDRRVRIRVSVGQELLLLHTVKTGCGSHPASYPLVTCTFPGGKATEACSLPLTAN
jgi:hypothetical protein